MALLRAAPRLDAVCSTGFVAERAQHILLSLMHATRPLAARQAPVAPSPAPAFATAVAPGESWESGCLDRDLC